jgi:hypothetical protein
MGLRLDQTLSKDREKHDHTRSILRKIRRGWDWIRPSQRVLTLRPVSLYYAVEKLVVPDELRDVTYIDWITAL